MEYFLEILQNKDLCLVIVWQIRLTMLPILLVIQQIESKWISIQRFHFNLITEVSKFKIFINFF